MDGDGSTGGTVGCASEGRGFGAGGAGGYFYSTAWNARVKYELALIVQ